MEKIIMVQPRVGIVATTSSMYFPQLNVRWYEQLAAFNNVLAKTLTSFTIMYDTHTHTDAGLRLLLKDLFASAGSQLAET